MKYFRWIDTIEQAQYTDVHYGAIGNECCFNWRMIFRFLYHHAEKKVNSNCILYNYCLIITD